MRDSVAETIFHIKERTQMHREQSKSVVKRVCLNLLDYIPA